jgi:hypothetical protein
MMNIEGMMMMVNIVDISIPNNYFSSSDPFRLEFNFFILDIIFKGFGNKTQHKED